MKLFLSSVAISKEQSVELAKLVGKDAASITLALIENAADTYAEGSRAWVDQNRAAITSHGFDVERVDLRDYKGKTSELKAKLSAKDVVWFGGGNTFYLRWLLRDTGADQVVVGLVKNGLVYGGGSAGAIIAGPTLQFFEAADDPGDAPEVILDGLGLTERVVVPHADNVKFANIVQSINKNLLAKDYRTALLADSQALIIKGKEQRII